MSDNGIDALEARLRTAAGLSRLERNDPNDSRSFIARLGGCGARVQLDHIDGRPVGGVSIMLHHLTHDAAEAVLMFLARRNEPNGGAA